MGRHSGPARPDPLESPPRPPWIAMAARIGRGARTSGRARSPSQPLPSGLWPMFMTPAFGTSARSPRLVFTSSLFLVAGPRRSSPFSRERPGRGVVPGRPFLARSLKPDAAGVGRPMAWPGLVTCPAPIVITPSPAPRLATQPKRPRSSVDPRFLEVATNHPRSGPGLR